MFLSIMTLLIRSLVVMTLSSKTNASLLPNPEAPSGRNWLTSIFLFYFFLFLFVLFLANRLSIFSLLFSCNYVSVLYRFRDKAIYLSKIATFHPPSAFDASVKRDPTEFRYNVACKKTKLVGLEGESLKYV